MAYQSIWYFSDLPKDVVEILDRDLYTRFDNEMDESRLHGDTIDKNKRNSKIFQHSSNWKFGRYRI